MFQLTDEEASALRSQDVTLKGPWPLFEIPAVRLQPGRRCHALIGLRTKRAVPMNTLIMRAWEVSDAVALLEAEEARRAA
jgi:hypothetical protein